MPQKDWFYRKYEFLVQFAEIGNKALFTVAFCYCFTFQIGFIILPFIDIIRIEFWR